MERFETGNWAAWNEGLDLDAEDMKRLRMLKACFGEGPFIVTLIKSVPKEDVSRARHDQYLWLGDRSGTPLTPRNGLQPKVSGFWLKKIKAPHHLIN